MMAMIVMVHFQKLAVSPFWNPCDNVVGRSTYEKLLTAGNSHMASRSRHRRLKTINSTVPVCSYPKPILRDPI